MITDTHAHLYDPALLPDIDEILIRAKDAGLVRIIIPAVDPETSETAIRLSDKYEMIYCAIGIHPSEANKHDLKALDKIEKLLDHPKVVAIGETGLDYYWDKSYIEKQKSFFRMQIELAKSYNLPIVIHTRDSVEDAIEIVKEHKDETLSGQFHCFSGNETRLKEVLSLDDFYISYCGNITYKNSGETELIKLTPADRLLSETDSPYLTPVPFRGRRNEPSYINHTLQRIAEVKETSLEGLIKIINENVDTVFFGKSI